MRGKKAQFWESLIGWAAIALIIFVFVIVFLNRCSIFGIGCPPEQKDLLIDADENIVYPNEEPNELQKICNNIIVNGEPYSFLRVMAEGLKKSNNASDVIYGSPLESVSDVELLQKTGLVFCKVPVELCWTENVGGLPNYRDGTYCMLWKLEVPIKKNEYDEWYKKVSGG